MDKGEDETKNAIVHTYQKWPEAQIPYVISGKLFGYLLMFINTVSSNLQLCKK